MHSLINPWVFIGFFGQFIFFLRFIIQWFATEKNKQVTIPVAFWYLSIIGTAIILVYSLHIHDIVFTTAQFLSFGIYFRNLYFIYYPEKKQMPELADQSTIVEA